MDPAALGHDCGEWVIMFTDAPRVPDRDAVVLLGMQLRVV